MSGFGLVITNHLRRGYAYRWLLLVPTVLVFALVTFYVSLQPDRYEAQTVLMTPLKQPISQTAQQDAEKVARDMFRSATERLLSNAMLLQVARDLDPYPQVRERHGWEAVVDQLRGQIHVDVNRGSGAITVFCSHDSGDNPAQAAADILNTLTRHFVQGQRDAIEDQYQKAVTFLADEKRKLHGELETAENRVRDFKAKHQRELPDDVEHNREEIERLQQMLFTYHQTKKANALGIEAVIREMARLDIDVATAQETSSVDVATLMSTAETNLATLKLDLKKLLFRFNEDNEDVLAQKAAIRAQEEAIAELSKSSHAMSTEKRIDYLRMSLDGNIKYREHLRTEMGEIDAEIHKTQKRMDDARQRITIAAQIEGPYRSLTRVQDEAQSKYDVVVERFEAARRKKELADYDAFVPIQVEQKAFAPPAPAGPDRLVYPLVGLVIGLGIGVGLAVTRAKLDPSCHNADDLRALLPGAVMVTIPEVKQRGGRIGRTMLGILGGLVLAAIFAGTIGVMGLQLGWWGEPNMLDLLLGLR